MALDALTLMTTARRIAQSYIQSGIKRGLSGGQIIGALQKGGWWYKATDFGKDFSFWQDAFQKTLNIRYTNLQALMNPKHYIPTQWHMSARWETLFEVRTRNYATGETSERFVTIAHTHEEAGAELSDRELIRTRAELEDEVASMYGAYELEDVEEVTGILPIMGFFNPDVGT